MGRKNSIRLDDAQFDILVVAHLGSEVLGEFAVAETADADIEGWRAAALIDHEVRLISLLLELGDLVGGQHFVEKFTNLDGKLAVAARFEAHHRVLVDARVEQALVDSEVIFGRRFFRAGRGPRRTIGANLVSWDIIRRVWGV